MELQLIENLVLNCIRQNIEDSEGEVPEITPTTEVFTGIAGFDSLRAIEVLITLEETVERELSPDAVFVKQPPGSDQICDMARAIKVIVDEGEA